MGEVIELGSASGGGFGLLSALISAAALGIYALTQSGSGNNDDDDSNPGGGLMQPVAGAA